MNNIKIILLTALVMALVSCGTSQKNLSAEEAKQIAKEAYIYGFPMVVNYKTMYNYALDKNSPEYKGDFNQLGCDARVYTPNDKSIVTPNSDTPYCMFWGDLRSEPLVLTIPPMEANRFYEVQLVDLYTHNFAYVSTVSKGNVSGRYLITGTNWKGDVPEGIKEVISCETPFLFAIIRTQLFNPDDLKNVKAIQDSYRFEPLSIYQNTENRAPQSEIEFPAWKEGAQFTSASFDYIDFMLGLVDTPAEEEKQMLQFSKIGLGTKDKFDINQFSPEIQAAMEDGVKEGMEELKSYINKHTSDPLSSGKIFGTRAFLTESAQKYFGLDNFYILRMAAAHTGLYGNSIEEAIYPANFIDNEGNALDASSNKYKLTFPKGKLPPVSAFWSLTMYDGKSQLLVENSLDRYLLNSPMIDHFKINEDGSLTFYFQKESPGTELESNWLPAPDGPFYIVMRLYGPQKAALNGDWVNPPMLKSSELKK